MKVQREYFFSTIKFHLEQWFGCRGRPSRTAGQQASNFAQGSIFSNVTDERNVILYTFEAVKKRQSQVYDCNLIFVLIHNRLNLVLALSVF